MPTSISGWPVLDNPAWGDPRAKKAKVPGVGTDLWVREEAWPLFSALVRDYNRLINKVTHSDGYDYRPSRVPGAGWSNHSAGVAIDINASAEGAVGTGVNAWWKQFNRNLKAQRIRKIYEIVNWGASVDIADDPHTTQTEGWSNSWADAMHWELKSGTTVADVERVIKKLRIGQDGIRRDRKGNIVRHV